MSPEKVPSESSDPGRAAAGRMRELPGALALVILAAYFFIGSLDLSFGTLRRLGPGYFPLALSVLLTGLAVAILIAGPKAEHSSGETFRLRPFLAIGGAIFVFILTIRPLGLIPAIILTVGIAALGDKQARPWQVLLLAVAVAIAVWVLFTRGLGIHIPAFPR